MKETTRRREFAAKNEPEEAISIFLPPLCAPLLLRRCARFFLNSFLGLPRRASKYASMSGESHCWKPMNLRAILPRGR